MTGNPLSPERAWISRARSLAADNARHLGRSWARRTHILAPAVSVALAVLTCTVSVSALDNFAPSAPSGARTAAATTVTRPAYPLKASANNRYLVDQDNVPFLMIGDSPQALIGNSSQTEAATFIANRQAYGINALWINLLCNDTTGCKSDGTTFDGIAPFTEPGDLSTPNPAYFQRADDLIRLAAMYGIIVILDPIETIGWLNILKANGVARAFACGQYLGQRYKEFPNLIWMHGNDFQSWRDSIQHGLAQSVGQTNKRMNSKYLHWVVLLIPSSRLVHDSSWAPR